MLAFWIILGIFGWLALGARIALVMITRVDMYMGCNMEVTKTSLGSKCYTYIHQCRSSHWAGCWRKRPAALEADFGAAVGACFLGIFWPLILLPLLVLIKPPKTVRALQQDAAKAALKQKETQAQLDQAMKVVNSFDASQTLTRR